jgi:hypothetical protein
MTATRTHGPMPLAQAREVLRGTRRFVKGEGVVDGEHVLAADVLWAALLSLEDAAEFVEVASRLDWQFHPRGFNNTELHERYGDGIVPWLASRVGDDGALHNNPWCVVPCLLACASVEAFALAWDVRGVVGATPWGGAGDTDLVVAWATRHPEVARAELERRAPDDARARAYLRGLWDPTPTPATAGDVLGLLDALAGGLITSRVRLWPPESTHDLRIVAAREGDDWGIAIERVDGTRPRGFMAARVVTMAYGSRVRGTVPGAATSTRPVPDLTAADLDTRLGPARLALEALGLSPAASVVAVVPHAAHVALPSASPVFARLAAALTD